MTLIEKGMIDGGGAGINPLSVVQCMLQQTKRKALCTAVRTLLCCSNSWAAVSAIGVRPHGSCMRIRSASAKSCAENANDGEEGMAIISAEA